MDQRALIDGLISYICLVILITFHEFGHAWMSSKRGDDTARLLGRVSLNPVVHMDLWGTVILPLVAIFLASSGSTLSRFIIGWGKPVPVNSANLKNRNLDWVLVALAGPVMNILLGIVSMALVRGGIAVESAHLQEFALQLAVMNFALCFFNLIPIPPLDGSHLLRYFVGMSEETFLQLSRYGFFALLLVIQLPMMRGLLSFATIGSVMVLGRLFGIEV